MSTPADFLPNLEEDLHYALNAYNKGDSAGSPLRYLHLYQRAQQSAVQTVRASTNRLLHTGLELLKQAQPDYAAILHYRFVEELPAHEVARRLTFAEGTVFKKQREGIAALAEILRQQETIAHGEAQERCYNRLEGGLSQPLFGVDDQIEQLAQQLLQADAPWLLCIEGIGGLGKTALADALVRSLLRQGAIGYGPLVDVGWVTARQCVLNGGGAIKTVPMPALTSEALMDQLLVQLCNLGQEAVGLPAAQKLNILRQRLKTFPHLVVIDNLETVLDVEHLLDTIRLLANPSKFLLTSRQSLFFQPDLYHWQLRELSTQNSLALIRYEASVRNLPALIHANNDELQTIYETVGGNPLAIKLIMGQLHTFALDEVLADLRQAQGQKAEHLYSYIYRQIWERLDEVQQRILLLMPLAAEQGADLNFLSAMATSVGIEPPRLRDGLAHLSALNLIENRGDLHRRRYAIHSLTRTFLQQDVLRWAISL
ncbi:MAG: NB-ARC domain-containing protein [Caldilineaceae bacterium]